MPPCRTCPRRLVPLPLLIGHSVQATSPSYSTSGSFPASATAHAMTMKPGHRCRHAAPTLTTIRARPRRPHLILRHPRPQPNILQLKSTLYQNWPRKWSLLHPAWCRIGLPLDEEAFTSLLLFSRVQLHASSCIIHMVGRMCIVLFKS